MSNAVRDVTETDGMPEEPRGHLGYVDDIEWVPTTEYERRMLELRRRIIAEQGLLDREGLEREIAERRGGLYICPDR